MEEDIKILREIKKEFITKMKKDITHNDNPIRYRNIQALQNILNELERLQKENALNSEKTVHTCLHCGNDTPLYCEKCQQELISKNAELQLEIEKLQEEIMENDLKIIGAEEYTKASMGEIIENYYTANEYCVPKQVIKDKIEEVNEEYKKYTEKWEKSGMNKEHPFYKYIVRLEAQIEILEELLGE